MDDREIELIDYLRVLWRQKWVVLATVVVAAVVAWAASRVVTPTYETEISLLVLPAPSGSFTAEELETPLGPEVYRQLALSTAVLQATIDELEDSGAAAVTLGALRSRLSVSSTPLDTEDAILLIAQVRGTDSETLPVIAQAWSRAFAAQTSVLLQDRAARTIGSIERSSAQQEDAMAALAQQRLVFLEESEMDLIRSERDTLRSVLESNTRRLLESQQESESAKAYLSAAEGDRTSGAPTLVLTSAIDPYTLTGALAFGLSADEYARLVDARIAELQRTTEAVRQDLAAKQQQLDAASATLEALDRKIDLAQRNATDLALRLESAKAAQAESPEPIRVIREPAVPGSAAGSGHTTRILIAAFLGLLFGVLLAFLIDYVQGVHRREGVPARQSAQQEKGPSGNGSREPPPAGP